MSTVSPVVETDNLTKVFGTNRVVDGVSLQLPPGTIYGLVGPNGAGKSTLLKLLIGYYWPTTGTVRVMGLPLTRDAGEVRQHLHLVSPEWDIFKTFRIEDIVRYYKLLYPQFDESRSGRLLRALELPTRARVRNLSLGMKMQLRLALALSAHPDVLLLDEPTNGLDPLVKRQFLQLLVQESAVDGTTIFLATHHLDDLDRIADGVAVMHQGRLLTMTDLDALKANVKEIQFVFPGELPDSIMQLPGLVSHQQKGQFHTIVIEGTTRLATDSLQLSGALHIELADLSFDELFRRLMEKEGYSRESLLL